MKPYLFAFLILLFFSCGQRSSKQNDSNDVFCASVDNTLIEPTVVKDSIDILMEQRLEEEYNSTIFAGLRFGSNRQSVERAMKNKSSREILVPVGDCVNTVTIGSYKAVYFNDGLASLELYSNDTRLKKYLDTLYTAKYGETKNSIWSFSNCVISIEKRDRKVYSTPSGWLASEKTWYYDSFGHSDTKRITEDPYYLTISYNNHLLLKALERQKHIKDSLEVERQNREAQKEKELAEKLKREIPKNI